MSFFIRRPGSDAPPDTVVIYSPRSRKALRTILSESRLAVKPHEIAVPGRIVGASGMGGNSAIMKVMNYLLLLDMMMHRRHHAGIRIASLFHRGQS